MANEAKMSAHPRADLPEPSKVEALRKEMERVAYDEMWAGSLEVDVPKRTLIAAAAALARLATKVEELEATQGGADSQVLDGWKLVPIEPLPEMLGAFWRVKNGHHYHDEPEPTDRSDYAAYRAMLASAPVQPQPTVSASETERAGGVREAAIEAIGKWHMEQEPNTAGMSESLARDLMSEWHHDGRTVKECQRVIRRLAPPAAPDRSYEYTEHGVAIPPPAAPAEGVKVWALWQVGMFGDGSTPDGQAMIFCDAWEATIAGPIDESLARELVDAHNAALAAAPAPALVTEPGEGMAEMAEIARIVGEWRHGPMLSPEAIRQIRAALVTEPEAEGEAVVYASAEQIAELADRDDDGGVYIPLRRKPHGLFRMPLYAHPLAAGARVAELTDYAEKADAAYDGMVKRWEAAEARLETMVRALEPFAKAGKLFPPRKTGSYDEGVYIPAAGREYAIGGDDLRRAAQALSDQPVTSADATPTPQED